MQIFLSSLGDNGFKHRCLWKVRFAGNQWLLMNSPCSVTLRLKVSWLTNTISTASVPSPSPTAKRAWFYSKPSSILHVAYFHREPDEHLRSRALHQTNALKAIFNIVPEDQVIGKLFHFPRTPYRHLFQLPGIWRRQKHRAERMNYSTKYSSRKHPTSKK